MNPRPSPCEGDVRSVLNAHTRLDYRPEKRASKKDYFIFQEEVDRRGKNAIANEKVVQAYGSIYLGRGREPKFLFCPLQMLL